MNLAQKLLNKINSLSTLYIGTILVLSTCFVYFNTLGNGLFFDDEDFIYKNQFVANFDIPHLFTQNLIAGAGKVSNYYRPILGISFAIEHALFGYGGFIYHFDSIIIQAAVAILVFLLLYKLFDNKPLAFLASFLFAIHPIQTEAVAYASGRGDPLSAFFMLIAILLSFSKKPKLIITSLIMTIAALLSKEVTLMTPGLIFLCHIIYSYTHMSKKAQKKHSFSYIDSTIQAVKHAIPYAIVTGIYFILRLTVLNFQDTLNFYGGTNIYTGSVFVRLNTFLNLLPKYIGLLFYPKILFIERPAYVFPTLTIETGVVLVMIAALLFIGIKMFKQYPIILFSTLWFFIAFIPASGIVPINGIFYEHFLYFPSIGFFALCAFLIVLFFEKVQINFIASLIFILLIVYFSWFCVRTIQRNEDWHDPIRFYTQTLQHNQSSRLYNNLAMAYSDAGDAKNAIINYKKGIGFGDFYAETHYNLGNQYVALNDLKHAEIEYKNALKINPGFYLSYIKLFEIYKNENNTNGVQWALSQVKSLATQNSNFQTLYNQMLQVK